jgi:hypothetical protein
VDAYTDANEGADEGVVTPTSVSLIVVASWDTATYAATDAAKEAVTDAVGLAP